MSNEWQGKSVLVLGLGDTGLSVVRWLARRGARLRAADTRTAPPALGAVRADHPEVGVTLGPFDEALLAGVDAVVASPGVALGEPVLRAAAGRGIEVVGDVEIFARELRRLGKARVLGVTGTNGKSTVTALAAEMAKAASRRAVAVGNIGVPVLDMLSAAQADPRHAPEVYVVELSSYQLETTSSLELDAAAVLNVTQDHLDRYDSMDAYAAAKERIFMHAKACVVNRGDARTLAMARDPASTFTFGLDVPASDRDWGLDAQRQYLRHGARDLVAVDEMGMLGLHNAANALAAHALGSAIGLPQLQMATAIRQFRGLPHRVELVAEARGVRFYDDSKGTNVGATVAALEGFTAPVVLIAGGEGKGQDFTRLAGAVKAHARAVVLIGRDAPAIEAALAATGVATQRAATLPEAIEAAYKRAQPDAAVLLSPACASLDMFRNYGHRGEVFAQAARALAARIGR